MLAICVDDEPILLTWLYKMVIASPDIERAEKFTSEIAALAYAEQNPFDVAFLDIELHATDGLSLAEHLREINPDCGIVFCTGHSGYAVDAIARLHVDGYLLKPIDGAEVQREIDRIKARFQQNETLLTVDFSHGINIFDKSGRTIHFRRGKTEELLAALVQQNGKSISTQALCELLWPDSRNSQYLYEKNENYLSQLLSDLRQSLEKCGAQDVLKKTSDGYAICMPLVDCGKG